MIDRVLYMNYLYIIGCYDELCGIHLPTTGLSIEVDHIEWIYWKRGKCKGTLYGIESKEINGC
jgi:hypothetical protein